MPNIYGIDSAKKIVKSKVFRDESDCLWVYQLKRIIVWSEWILNTIQWIINFIPQIALWETSGLTQAVGRVVSADTLSVLVQSSDYNRWLLHIEVINTWKEWDSAQREEYVLIKS